MQDSEIIERAALAAAAVDKVRETLDEGGEAATALLRAILRRGLAGEPIGDLPLEGMRGELLVQGAATAMRDIGRYDIEAALLRHAIEMQPRPFLYRRLSMALLRTGEVAQSREFADQAERTSPDASIPIFDRHLDDLAGAGWIDGELRAPAPPKTPPSPDATVAYCLHNSRPHAVGGYAMRSHALAEAIGNRGRKIIAVARPGFPADGGTDLASIAATSRVDATAYHFETAFGRRGRSFGYLRDATDYFARVFEAQQIGIVHAATNFWTALPAGLAARRLGLPFVYEVRSFWSVTREAEEPGFRELPQARRDDLLEELALSLADRVMALNSAMADALGEFGVDPGAVKIIPNCVDTEHFRPAPRDAELAARYGLPGDGIVIGYIGAMREYEGLDVLIEAVRSLAARHPKLNLAIFGVDPAKAARPGTIEHDLSALAGQSDAVRLLPRVPPEDVPRLYRCFDICAYPRRGFAVTETVPPLKPLEAMASGAAVVVSDVGGMRDLIDPERTGLICVKDDPDSLAEMLARLSDDPGLRARLGAAARNFVATERRWEDAAARVEDCYASLGKQRDRARRRSVDGLLGALFGAGH